MMGSPVGHCLFVDSAKIRVWEGWGSGARFVEELPNEKGLRSLLSRPYLSKGSKVKVLLDSDCVLFSSVRLSATSRSDPQAATYEAEPYFPLAAEDMVTSIDVRLDGAASFLVIDRNWYEPFCSSLNDRGIKIQQVVPTSPTIAFAATKGSALQQVLLNRNELSESLKIKSFHLESWTCHDTQQNSETGSLDTGSSIEKGSPIAQAGSELIHLNYHTAEAFERAALEALEKIRPAIQRGKIALTFPTSAKQESDSRNTPWELVAIVACLVMLIGASIFWVRGQQYQEYSQLADREITRLAKESFPNQRVSSLRRSLNAELQTKQRQIETWRTVGQRDGVARTLYVFLQAVPAQPGVEFRLLDIQSGMIRIEGNASELESVAQFAEALRRSSLRVNEKKYGLQFELEVEATMGHDTKPATNPESTNQTQVNFRQRSEEH